MFPVGSKHPDALFCALPLDPDVPIMKLSFRAALPVFTILLSALLVFATANAQDGATVTETVTVTETGGVTEITIEEKPAASGSGNFQGLIPPAGSAPKINYGGPRHDSNDTHPPLRLTPDKSEIVRLEEDAVSIIVGNPDHLGILMDDSRLLILVPRQPGATYLTVLNQAGQVIMQRHVIVSVANQNYIRIRRSCGNDSACQQTTVYYCDGMCHETAIVRNNGSSVVPPPVSSRRAAATGPDVTVDSPAPANPEPVEVEEDEPVDEPDEETDE